MKDLQLSSKKLKQSFEQVYKNKLPLERGSLSKTLINYKATKDEYIRNSLFSAVRDFNARLDYLTDTPEGARIKTLVSEIKGDDLDRIKRIIDTIDELVQGMEAPRKVLNLKPRNIPDAIRGEIEADIKEMESCFHNSLYRSAIILCGRILEIALHRKYFEKVGVDLLEKSPGIGLGKIISKLIEKEIDLDPGLTQQVHLINQVRIFTVHKKQKAFYPSKAQAHAMILYTTDILDKLF